MTVAVPIPHVRAVPRRGLSREEAAQYVGISATKFDQLVRSGRMPKAKQIDGRKVWDVRRLDIAFDALPDQDGQVASSWDDV
jgi:excisionase family DNA binding protein